MDYRKQNTIGKGLEIAGVVGLGLVICYDLHPLISLAPFFSLVYGSGLRDAAVEKARIDGINSCQERRPESDLSDEVDSCLPFLP